MATRRNAPPPDVDDVDEVEDLRSSSVRSLEPEPEETLYQGVEEQAPATARTDLTTTSAFFDPTAVTEVVEVEPEIIEGDEPMYNVRLTTDVDTVFIGVDYQIPPMKKDVLYEVTKKVYDYLLPKGLIQGK